MSRFVGAEVELGRAKLVQFICWNSEEHLRVQNFDGLASLYTEDRIKARFGEEPDAALQSSGLALEMTVTRLFEDPTPGDLMNDSASVCALRSCLGWFVDKSSKSNELVNGKAMATPLPMVEHHVLNLTFEPSLMTLLCNTLMSFACFSLSL